MFPKQSFGVWLFLWLCLLKLLSVREKQHL